MFGLYTLESIKLHLRSYMYMDEPKTPQSQISGQVTEKKPQKLTKIGSDFK